MGPVAATGRIVDARLSRHPSIGQARGDADRAPSRALVPIAPAGRAMVSRHNLQRPSAPFLAQLIAASAHAPQARARRRAAPSEAIAAYTATARII